VNEERVREESGAGSGEKRVRRREWGPKKKKKELL